jgi:hypothetical protein
MPWSCLHIEANREDIEVVLRSAWEKAYADAFLNFRHAVFRDRSTAIYFSPATLDLAEAFGATTCDAPTKEGLRLVAGDSRSWDVWFPSQAQRPQKRRTLHLPQREPAAAE